MGSSVQPPNGMINFIDVNSARDDRRWRRRRGLANNETIKSQYNADTN
jgi:hypothetical protein